MTAAAAPYVAWLSSTAAQAEQAAAQAEAAVAAYEAAFAATVPPPVIAANRAQLVALIATNFFGQNTLAIAATEAQYLEMWAQDAAAMYGYAGSSAAASQLTSFTQPAQIANATGPTAQVAAVTQAAATEAGTGQSTLSQLLSALPGALQSLASPASSGSGLSGILDGFNIFAPGSGSSTSGLSGILNVISGANGSAFGEFLNSNALNSIFASGFYMPGRYLGNTSAFMGLAGKGADAAAGESTGPSGRGTAKSTGQCRGAGRLRVVGLGVVGFGPSGPYRSAIGTTELDGPAPLHSPLSSSLGAAPMEAPPPAVAGSTPPVPLANMGAQGEGRAVPQCGFRPSFVARPPAAG